jgi:hypothetical protein
MVGRCAKGYKVLKSYLTWRGAILADSFRVGTNQHPPQTKREPISQRRAANA